MAIKTIVIIFAEIALCALLHRFSLVEQKKDKDMATWAIIDGEFIDFTETVGEDA